MPKKQSETKELTFPPFCRDAEEWAVMKPWVDHFVQTYTDADALGFRDWQPLRDYIRGALLHFQIFTEEHSDGIEERIGLIEDDAISDYMAGRLELRYEHNRYWIRPNVFLSWIPGAPSYPDRALARWVMSAAAWQVSRTAPVDLLADAPKRDESKKQGRTRRGRPRGTAATTDLIQDRRIYKLHHTDGKSYAEIAIQMKTTKRDVMKACDRQRKRKERSA